MEIGGKSKGEATAFGESGFRIKDCSQEVTVQVARYKRQGRASKVIKGACQRKIVSVIFRGYMVNFCLHFTYNVRGLALVGNCVKIWGWLWMYD
jgi:hypothetical protein